MGFIVLLHCLDKRICQDSQKLAVKSIHFLTQQHEALLTRGMLTSQYWILVDNTIPFLMFRLHNYDGHCVRLADYRAINSCRDSAPRGMSDRRHVGHRPIMARDVRDVIATEVLGDKRVDEVARL